MKRQSKKAPLTQVEPIAIEETMKNQQPESEKKSTLRSAEFWVVISIIVSVVATSFAGWAALETRRSALETAKATRATVWMQMLNEYAEPEMLNSMKALREWRNQDTALFAKKFQLLLLKTDKTPEEINIIKELDAHRRRVASFFNKLKVLTKGGVIDEIFISSTWSTGTYTYVKDVLIPIEHAKSESLLKSGNTTEKDMQISVAIEKDILKFYKQISDISEKVYLE